MLGATISVYINQQFTWTLSKDPFGERSPQAALRVATADLSPAKQSMGCM